MLTLSLLYLVLILTVLASGSLIFLVRSDDQRILKLLLAFSGAFLIGISFLKLVPEVFSSPAKYIGLFVMLGFLIQLVLELITEGAEHGHSHQHTEGESVSPFLLLTGLCIHSFLEGMPIVGAFTTGIQHTLVIGIVIHNIPISLTLMSLFLHYGLSKRRALFFLVVFSLMTPLGSILSNFIQMFSTVSLEIYFDYIMAVVIGIFLHVSTSIIFEAEDNHKYNLQKFASVCLGIAVAFGLSLI
ncbi:MAG: ZIP family metal transporter [Bacteroidetes bacterium]|nr:ZIP family metal transporter [Bacteroidota bacterium]